MIVKTLVAKELKKARKINNIKIEEIASKIGVMKKTVFNYETGIFNLSNMDKFFNICRAYKVNPFTVVKAAENTFLKEFSNDNHLSEDEKQRYLNEFKELHSKLLNEKSKINKKIQDNLNNVVDDLFFLNEIYDEEEKFNLSVLLNSMLDIRIQQNKK